MSLETFDGKLVFFKTRDDMKTAGFLMEYGKDDIVLFIHGMGGNFYKMGFLKGARELSKMGISFFSFNTRGADIVKDFRDMRGEHHTMGTAFERFEDLEKDIGAAIDFLSFLGFKRFHLIGHSTGCQKILYYAWKSGDSRVKSLIHVSPAEDYEIWKNSLGEDFEKFVEMAWEMQSKGDGDKLLIPLYEKTGEIWSASRFLSFASRENYEARMFNYEGLEIFSQVKLPMQIFLGTDDPYFPRGVEWYASKLRNAYQGRNLRIEIMPGDHSFHGYEEILFQKIEGFVRAL